MRAGHFLAASLWLATLAAAIPAADAAEQVGDARRVVKLVTAGGSRELQNRDPVYRDENISAGSGSRGELLLSDGSKLIVGENSTIILDNFVLGDKGFQSATIKVAKGAFRYISGSSPKGAVEFQTPLASIGVRGTTLDVYVEENGTTRVLVLSGEVRTCNAAGQCIITRRACDIVEVRSRTDIRQLDFLRSRNRGRSQEAQDYALTENQQRHSNGWRAPVGGCSVRAALELQRNFNDRGPADKPGSQPPPPPQRDKKDRDKDDEEECRECG